MAAGRCSKCGTILPPLPEKREIEKGACLGRTLRYQLETRLGAGRFAEVWLAHDLKKRGAPVALKILKAPVKKLKSPVLNSCRAVAKTASSVIHPNLARIYGFEADKDFAFFVTEYVKGPTLSTLLKESKRLGEDEVLWVAREVCMGLHYLHQIGLYHGELDLSNLLLSQIPTEGRLPTIPTSLGYPHQCVRMSDWLVSRYLSATAHFQSSTGGNGEKKEKPDRQRCIAVGTVADDLCALRALLYKMLTGRAMPLSARLRWTHAKTQPFPKGASALMRMVLQTCLLTTTPPEAARPGGGEAGHLVTMIEQAYLHQRRTGGETA
jgi:serine/threonine protein kinase